MAYDRLSGYLLDAEPEVEIVRLDQQMLAASWRAVELVPAEPPTPCGPGPHKARSLIVARDYEAARDRARRRWPWPGPLAASATRPPPC